MYTSARHPEHNGRRSASKGTLRQVNDTIRALAERSAADGEGWEFLCECDDLSCLELVELTLAEFDAHRDDGAARPILARHHHDG